MAVVAIFGGELQLNTPLKLLYILGFIIVATGRFAKTERAFGFEPSTDWVVP